MSHAVLEAANVTKSFPGGIHALAEVDLTVNEGETVVLVGESGSGKTTLLRMFNRMAEPTQGTIRIRGRAAASWNPIALRRSIGYVQQEGGLLPHWTVGRNVALVPRLLGWPDAKSRDQVSRLLELVGLDPPVYRDRYPVELSGGERQRVAVARALGGEADTILLDEPFGALDAITRVDLHRQFLRMKARLKKTMVLVTHDLAEAFRLGDRIAVMKSGRILQMGRASELEQAPANDYVRELLSHRGELTA